MGFNFDFTNDKPRDPEELALALARIAAHSAFDKLWKEGSYSRSGAYRWLARELGISAEYCHIKQFDEATCRKVLCLSTARFNRLVSAAVRYDI